MAFHFLLREPRPTPCSYSSSHRDVAPNRSSSRISGAAWPAAGWVRDKTTTGRIIALGTFFIAASEPALRDSAANAWSERTNWRAGTNRCVLRGLNSVEIIECDKLCVLAHAWRAIAIHATVDESVECGGVDRSNTKPKLSTPLFLSSQASISSSNRPMVPAAKQLPALMGPRCVDAGEGFAFPVPIPLEKSGLLREPHHVGILKKK